MLRLRRAGAGDLEFLVRLDLEDEGYTSDQDGTSADVERHRAKIARFVRDADKVAWVIESPQAQVPVAGILCLFRDLTKETPPQTRPDSESMRNWRFYQSIRPHLPGDGRFAEVFNLWVAPAYRRQGLATRLKRQLEAAARCRDISMVYTHTEAVNPHVVELNLKLGYREIRRGPIWDEVERVSLVKKLS